MGHPILSVTMKDAQEAIVRGAYITDGLSLLQFVLPGIGDVNLYFPSMLDMSAFVTRIRVAFLTANATRSLQENGGPHETT